MRVHPSVSECVQTCLWQHRRVFLAVCTSVFVLAKSSTAFACAEPRRCQPLPARGTAPSQVGGDGGLQLSAGQQQLLCLARALLRRSRLVLLDECTSCVDPPTAALMRSVLAEQLGGRQTAVLQIAHDLRAILDYDRVLLMDHGRIVEDGPPRALAAEGRTRFAQLLARAGRGAAGG